MKTLLKAWLLIVAFYLIGMASVMFGIQPAPALLDAYLYATDNRWETRSLTERLKSDLDILPYRVLTRDAGGAATGAGFVEIDLPGRRDRRQNPQVFVAADRPSRLTLIQGVFDFTDGLHGAILLDPEGRVMHRWTLTERTEYPGQQAGGHLYPHGILADPDGALTYLFDFGGTVNKIDWCGRTLWSVADGRDYNHVLERGDDGLIWTIDGQIKSFLALDPDTGAVSREIDFADVLKANADRGLFTARFDHFETGPRALADPFHANDVEPLTADLAPAFPMFNAGDLLVSLRALNLIFVMDAETLKVKWYSQGEMQLQHDPDFEPDGTITALDNHWFRPPSRLLSFDPTDPVPRVALDGADHDFFTPNRGKHQWVDGARLVTSSKQGRVFEVGPDGRIIFEFVNTYDDAEGLRGLVSEAIALPVDYFRDLPTCD
jgi:hypothetical protein